MNLTQNRTKRETYISTKTEVLHTIKLHTPDDEYLKHNASNFTVVWWVNSIPKKTFNKFSPSWTHLYPEEDKTYTISVTIVAERKNDTVNSTSELFTVLDTIQSTNASLDSQFNTTNSSIEEELSSSTFPNITIDNFCKDNQTHVCGLFATKVVAKGIFHSIIT